MPEQPLLVIGVGNRDRGDDAVGPVVCDLLDASGVAGVRTRVLEGAVVDLPMHWQADDRVVVVDAVAPSGDAGRVVAVDAGSHRLVSPGTVSTHTVDVGAAIEIARALGRMPAALTIVGIEGAVFEFGTGLSAPVAAAAERVAASIRAEVTRRAGRAAVAP